MNVSIVRSLPDAEWRQFVDQHPSGNIFHTPEMFEIFGRSKGYKPDLWAATSDGKILALLLPVQVTTLENKLFHSFTTRAVVFGGLLSVPSADGRDALKILLQSYNQRTRGRLLFTELRHQIDVDEFQPVLGETGFVYEEHSNYLVNLALSMDQVWQNIHSSARKKINQAQKNDAFQIEELNSDEKLLIWYEVLKRSFSWNHVFLADYSLFKTAFDVLHPQKKIRFFLARVGDDYVAASVRLLYKSTIYAWYSGFNRDFGRYRPNELMIWNNLKWGVENGYSVFDFGGAGRLNEPYGPREFKAKFGGQLVSYGRSVYVHAPLKLKLSKAGYSLIRKLL